MPFALAAAGLGLAGTVFGASKEEEAAGKAAESQERQNAASQKFVEAQTEKARNDALLLSGLSQGNAMAGAGGMRQALSGSAPAAFDAMRQGNMNAQNTIAAGTPQLRNALLGRQVDYGAMQARDVNPDFSFLQQEMPDFKGMSDLYASETLSPDDFAAKAEISSSLDGQVNEIFNKYLGRDVDAASMGPFARAIESKGIDYAIQTILESDEYKLKHPGGA